MRSYYSVKGRAQGGPNIFLRCRRGRQLTRGGYHNLSGSAKEEIVQNVKEKFWSKKSKKVRGFFGFLIEEKKVKASNLKPGLKLLGGVRLFRLFLD